jgi:DNA topoisomerase-3
MLRVIIAEKPSMGRAVAQALGVRGPSAGGRIVGDELIVTWAIGHLVELAPPESYRAEWKAWRAVSLPMVPPDGRFALEVTARTREQFEVVAGLLRRKDVGGVVNACDAGREGELIFDLIMRRAGCSLPVMRLWTASLTETAIRQAYATMRPAAHYAALRDAARSRQEADWLVGLNATRAQTVRARAGGSDSGVWSIGRVQTPTLALLVERQRAIVGFVPRAFYAVEADLRAAAGRFTATWFERRGKDLVQRLESRAQADALVARLAGAPARVERIDRKAVRTPPERLHDLTTLQREANRRLGLSAQKTLELAQALYEQHKVFTYPRTASRHLTTDVGATIPALVATLAQHIGPLGALAQALHARQPGLLGARFVDDREVDDHHAIIPTGSPPRHLSPQEQAIYGLVLGGHPKPASDGHLKTGQS